jgi:UDP-glucuronate 4-epimerase
MAHYLVTGAAGFIASRLCELLISAGHTVSGIDNLNDSYDMRMKDYRLMKLRDMPGFSFLRLDIADPQVIDVLSRSHIAGQEKIEAVFNLAARAGVRQSVENPWIYLKTNIDGTLNMLEFCRRQDIPKLIQASTSSVYGANAQLPTPEIADSDHPLQAYAASKKAAEVLCYAYHSLYGLDVTVFRYFTVYGPAGRPDMSVFRFVQWINEERAVQLHGDGTQSRGFTYVDDIARGTILGLKSLGYEVINLGGHENIRISQLIEMIEELVGKSARIDQFPPNPADMLANWADVSKAKKLLEWEPQVTLTEGLSKVVAWYRAERSWAKDINTQ